MKKIYFLLLVALTLPLTGCGEKEGIIPSSEMSAIIADFYYADSAVEMAQEDGSKEMRYVDSMKVYEPILEAHGFTKDAFRASLSYYLREPKKLNKIYQRAAAQLEALAEEKPGVVTTDEEDVTVEEGAEPAIEKEEGTVMEEVTEDVQKDKAPKSRPQRKMRKKMTKQELKQLEEELKKSNE